MRNDRLIFVVIVAIVTHLILLDWVRQTPSWQGLTQIIAYLLPSPMQDK